MESINLTNTLAGLAAIQRAMAGEDILFTRLEIGDGVLTDTDVSKMTGLINKTKDYVLGAVDAEDSEIVRLRSNLSNDGVTQDLIIREYGIYAKFGNEQEFLFAYLNTGNVTTPLPSERIGRYELNRDFVLYIGNSLEVDFKTNGHLIYVTISQYKNDMKGKANVVGTIEELKASKKYAVGDIVQVLGINEVSDGYFTFKIIESENVGNGIKLDNGLWANEIRFGSLKFISDKSKIFWKNFLKNKDVSFTAHRGYWRFAPENSLKAIRIAHDLGFNMVELDVRLSSDMVPMLMHDETIDRTTNGFGAIRNIDFNTLRTYYLTGDPNGDIMKIPTFEEAVLECKRFGITINIDSYFSYEFGSNPVAIQILYDILKKHNYLDKAFFMMNNHNVRLALKSIDPYICCGFLGNPNDYINECEAILKYFPNCLVGFNWNVDESVVRYYQDKNIPVYLYNAENYSSIEECIRKGARFIEGNIIIPREVNV